MVKEFMSYSNAHRIWVTIMVILLVIGTLCTIDGSTKSAIYSFSSVVLIGLCVRIERKADKLLDNL